MRHGALGAHAGPGAGEGSLALGLAGLLSTTARKHDVVAVAVHLDDAGLDAGAEIGVEVLIRGEGQRGRRQEAAKADIEDKAALDETSMTSPSTVSPELNYRLHAVPNLARTSARCLEGRDGPPCPPSEGREPQSGRQAELTSAGLSLRMESSRAGITPPQTCSRCQAGPRRARCCERFR